MSAPAAVATAAAGLLVAVVTTAVVLRHHAPAAVAPVASATHTAVPTDAAGRRLAAIALPPRTERCDDDATATMGFVCWHGAAEPQVTAGYLVHGLLGVGATDARGSCVSQPVLGPMCEVQATVASKPFHALITRPLAKDGHGTAPGSELVGDTRSRPHRLPPGEPLAIPLPKA